MDLLQVLNTALVSSAALIGTYAIGRLFYVASTAPTNVSRKRGVVGPTVFPTTAWQGGPAEVVLVFHPDGRTQYLGSIAKTGHTEETVK